MPMIWLSYQNGEIGNTDQQSLQRIYQLASGGMLNADLTKAFNWNNLTLEQSSKLYVSISKFLIAKQAEHHSTAFIARTILYADMDSNTTSENLLAGVKFIQDNVPIRDAFLMYGIDPTAMNINNLFEIALLTQPVTVEFT